MPEFFPATVSAKTSRRRKNRRKLTIRTSVFATTVLLLGGCASLPSSGPTVSQILAKQDIASPVRYEIVDLTSLTQFPEPAQPAQNWMVPPWTREIVVGPGDALSIRLFEIGTRLFSGALNVGDGTTTAAGEALPPVRVDEAGDITLPYIGKVHVAGLSTSAIETLINRHYRGYSQALRSMVSVSGNETNRVVLTGAVSRPGRFHLTQARERVLDVISEAGGVSGRPEDILVRLTRNGVSSQARLRQILDDPTMNNVLAAGDVLELDSQPLSYLVFGAAGKVAQISFGADRLSLAEAVARAGGPIDQQADPKGVFLFRHSPADKSGIRTIYRLDLMQPSSYFLSQNVFLQDKDVLYFANARSNQPSKFVMILNQLFSPLLTVRAIAN